MSGYKLDVSGKLTDFIKFCREARSMHNYCKTKVDEYEKGTYDYTHKYELEKMTQSQKAKLSTAFSTHLKERRFYKDRVEELQPLIDFLESDTGRVAFRNLEQTLGEVRKKESYHACRTYIPKMEKLKALEVKTSG